MRTRLIVLALCAAIAGPVLAEDQSLLMLGVGAGTERLAYKGAHMRKRAVPLIVYQNEWLAVSLPTADLKLPDFGPVSLRLRARFGFDGYKAKDATGLAGMATRRDGLWLGPAAVIEGELGELSLEATRDASGSSGGAGKGSQWRLQYEYTARLGALSLTPQLGVAGLDRKYVDYYYGVRATEVRPDRAAYTGRATQQLELGLRSSYALSQKSMLFVGLSANRLGSAAADSPLVERRYTGSLFAGWFYRL